MLALNIYELSIQLEENSIDFVKSIVFAFTFSFVYK